MDQMLAERALQDQGIFDPTREEPRQPAQPAQPIQPSQPVQPIQPPKLEQQPTQYYPLSDSGPVSRRT
jgi:hypothetical protein